jgi:hypothetical protein
MGSEIKTRPWNEIAEHYRGLVENNWDMDPMLNLVEEIACSRFADGVFAVTSMATLCIAQTREFEFDRNVLRVDFARGRFCFSYRESPYESKSWNKECGPDEGYSTFEHVVGRLRWFTN